MLIAKVRPEFVRDERGHRGRGVKEQRIQEAIKARPCAIVHILSDKSIIVYQKMKSYFQVDNIKEAIKI